jgi:hypothetical protein
MVHVFRNWTDATREFDRSLAEQVRTGGSTLMVSWQPPAGSIADIAAGQHDAYARAYARALRAWGGGLLLRFAHEMNGEWIPWRDEPAHYRAAWQRLHAIFDDEGADAVAWVWSPHVRDARAVPFEGYYPGDDVVDWLALDGYNWGRSQSDSSWLTFDDIFGASYRDLVRLAPGKPIMLAEIGCAEEGGDKGSWIRDSFLGAIPAGYPACHAVAWFHAYPHGHADWRIDSSPASLEAWREVAGSPLYSGAIRASDTVR